MSSSCECVNFRIGKEGKILTCSSNLRVVCLLQNDKVFSYHDQTLEAGNPKAFSEVFPGIPNHVDAAVECPKGECVRDTVIFFKGK